MGHNSHIRDSRVGDYMRVPAAAQIASTAWMRLWQTMKTGSPAPAHAATPNPLQTFSDRR